MSRATGKTAPTSPPQGDGFMGWLRGVDHYWFGRGSPVSLAVFRIVFASLAFINLAMISIDFKAWFSESGYVPQRLQQLDSGVLVSNFNLFGRTFDLGFHPPRINLLAYVVDDRISAIFYALVMLAALLTAIGLWTRISSILLAVGIVSLHHRNMLILHGGDTVLRVGVLYLALAPCGLACSLDRLIGQWKGRIGPEMPMVSLWSQRLISFNVALVYFTTFWHKLGFGTHWKDLTATWYPARLNEFDRFPVPAFFDDVPAVYVSTLATLAIELALGTIVFYRPARRYVLFGGLMLHGSIEYSMNIPLFAFVMCAMYISFYDGEEITAWAKRVGEKLARFRASVFAPAGTQLRPGPALALESLDCFSLLNYEPGTAEEWTAKTAAGKTLSGVWASWTRSLGAYPIAWIPGVWRRVLDKAIEPISDPPALQIAKSETKAPRDRSKVRR
jgi:hypothetical protein